MLTSVYSLSSEDWIKLLISKDQSPFILKSWLKGLYKNHTFWNRHIARDLILELQKELDFSLPIISKTLESTDETVKFQMQFPDGLEVETVLIPFKKRFTICLSTQVGCAMNCSFCFTGTQGFKRNLSSGEIIGQYLVAQRWLENKYPHSIKPSVVFMGQGEPLHNVQEVKKAIEIFIDKDQIDLGASQITLSTVGYLPKMKELYDFPKINLALSLHSPFEQERSKLIPINEHFSLDEVLPILDEIARQKNKITTYEYLLIKNFNMTDAHVQGLFELLTHRKAIINLIPFNPFPGSPWERPDIEEVENFRQKLVAKKLRVLVRTTKGDDILAACGQLKINKLARNYESRA